MARPPRRKLGPQMLRVPGSWGQFGGRGSAPLAYYLQAAASPGDSGTPACELASLLVPVREVFDLDRLSFDQILQRDLDDNRVAQELVPYLLDESNKARLFPPILAVVVPFTNNEMHAEYGEHRELRETTEDPDWTKVTLELGDVLKFVRDQDSDGQFERAAEMHLNRQKARLMVVDGQHRAMALLAIQRNLLNGWEGRSAAPYRHFYSEIGRGCTPEDLQRIELPVCLCTTASRSG